MGRDREFSQRLHLRLDRQAAVRLDLQVFREIHHRFDCNEMTLFIVKVEGGTGRRGGHRKGPGRLACAGHVHEHHLGYNAIPIGEMRKIQGKHTAVRSLRRGVAVALSS